MITYSKQFHRRKLGFTLIELLIVVAIIAILAAIAVPNFLEAQMRAQVTRVKADMRTMQTGMEMYRSDEGVYIPDNFSGQGGGAINDVKSFYKLTTPIAYIQSVPVSPFWEMNVRDAGNTGQPAYFEYWRGPNENSLDAGSKETGILYRMTSVGPDNLSDYHNEQTSGKSNWPLEIAGSTAKFLNGLYDPTNGTKSRGDLIFSSRGVHNN